MAPKAPAFSYRPARPPGLWSRLSPRTRASASRPGRLGVRCDQQADYTVGDQNDPPVCPPAW